MQRQAEPDHGGGLDAALARWGGARGEWMDLSTGINPDPWPVPPLSAESWTALPDRAAQDRLCLAARRFWGVPDGASILPAPGASALIARMPRLIASDLPSARRAAITGPTYNEHAHAFRQAGFGIVDSGRADVRVIVHPNNPDGRVWPATEAGQQLTVIDESFCDVMPEASQIARAADPGVIVLKSFGKFWGLAGLRLGFAIGRAEPLRRLAEMLGPWPVSGPALEIGAAALDDDAWARATRLRLADDAIRLDGLMQQAGARMTGGTSLFRLYDVPDAAEWQARLARARIWSRRFPWSDTALRLGLPPARGWARLADALRSA